MKKRCIAVTVLALAAFIYAGTRVEPIDLVGTRVDPGSLHTARNVWTVLDTTSSTGTEPTDLAVTERTYQTVRTAIDTGASGDDEISVFDVPRSWNGVRFRSIGITDAATVTYQIYIGTLGDGNRDTDSTTADCELAYLGELAFTIGTQTSTTSTYEMADTLTVTASDWTKSLTTASPTGNRVAETRVDLMGADVIVAVPTTVTADCKLLAKGF